MDWNDPRPLAILLGFTAVEAAALLGFIALVQATPRTPTNFDAPDALPESTDGPPPSFRRTAATGPARRDGFIARFGWPLAAVICFGVILAITVVAALPYGFLPATAGWWVAALVLFGLTVRQTFKANIALALVTIGIWVAIDLIDL